MVTADAMAAETFCGGCGYDLRGLSSDRCPECGLTIDPNRGGFIPWERRADLSDIMGSLTVLSVGV